MQDQNQEAISALAGFAVLKVGIIGCGLIGQKRAQALTGAQLAACCDKDLAKAHRFHQLFPAAKIYANWQELLAIHKSISWSLPLRIMRWQKLP